MRVEFEGKIIEFPDDLDPKEIEAQLATLEAAKSPEKMAGQTGQAIDLPASTSAQTGAQISDYFGGQSPLQALAGRIGMGEKKAPIQKLAMPGDVERIKNLKAPTTAEYYQRAGIPEPYATIAGVVTDIVTPLDLITLGTGAAKKLGKLAYKYGLGELSKKSDDIADLLYKENVWGRIGGSQKRPEAPTGRASKALRKGIDFIGYKKIPHAVEDIAKDRSAKIGNILKTGDEAGITLDITGMTKDITGQIKPKYRSMIEKVRREKAPVPEQKWVAPEMESALDIDKFIKEIGIDDPTKAGLEISNRWKKTLYDAAKENDPKAFEDMLVKAVSGKKTGKEVADVQRTLALEIRDEISKSLNDLKPGLGDEYLKVNKDLSSVYDVKKTLDKLANQTGEMFNEYDAALAARVPVMVMAKKAFSFFRAPPLTTGFGMLTKGIHNKLTGNAPAYLTRKTAAAIPGGSIFEE